MWTKSPSELALQTNLKSSNSFPKGTKLPMTIWVLCKKVTFSLLLQSSFCIIIDQVYFSSTDVECHWIWYSELESQRERERQRCMHCGFLWRRTLTVELSWLVWFGHLGHVIRKGVLLLRRITWNLSLFIVQRWFASRTAHEHCFPVSVCFLTMLLRLWIFTFCPKMVFCKPIL